MYSMVSRYYFVIRELQGEKKVLFMSESEAVARTRLNEYAENFRNGTMLLWECVLYREIERISGRYKYTQ